MLSCTVKKSARLGAALKIENSECDVVFMGVYFNTKRTDAYQHTTNHKTDRQPLFCVTPMTPTDPFVVLVSLLLTTFHLSRAARPQPTPNAAKFGPVELVLPKA